MKYYVLNYQNSGRSLSPLVKWGKEKDPLDKLAEIGKRFVWPQGLQLGSETKRGKLYDWLRCTFAPVVKERVKKRLERALTDEQVQWIGPFSLGRESYYLMNILTVIDCTTPESKYAYLYLKEDALEGVGICRIKQFLSKVLISEDFWWKIVEEEETGVYVNWLEEDGFIRDPWRVQEDRQKLLEILPCDHCPCFEKKGVTAEDALRSGNARDALLLLQSGDISSKQRGELLKMIIRQGDGSDAALTLKEYPESAAFASELVQAVLKRGGADDAYMVLLNCPEAAEPFRDKLLRLIVKEGSSTNACETLKNIPGAQAMADKLVKVILKEGTAGEAYELLRDFSEAAQPHLKAVMKKIMSERDGEMAYYTLHDCPSAAPYADELIDVMLDKEGMGTLALDFHVYSDLEKYAPLLIRHILRRGDGSDAYYMLKDYPEAWEYRDELMKAILERGEGYEAADLWKDVPASRQYADRLLPYILEKGDAYDMYAMLKEMDQWPEALPWKANLEERLVEMADLAFAERIRKESPRLSSLADKVAVAKKS